MKNQYIVGLVTFILTSVLLVISDELTKIKALPEGIKSFTHALSIVTSGSITIIFALALALSFLVESFMLTETKKDDKNEL